MSKEKEKITRAAQKSYTEEELVKYLEEDTKKGKLLHLYKEHYVNKKIPVKDKEIIQYDFVAKYLIEIKIDELFKNNIDKLSRHNYGKKYKIASHTPIDSPKKELISEQRREEEWLARSLLNRKFPLIGEIIDYQIPIKEKRSDTGVGKVDLLACNDENKKILSYIELKREKNQETLLRAILEICTYYYQINEEQLRKDYECSQNTAIQKAIFIFKDSSQHNELETSKSIKKLLKVLKVDVFVLEKNKNNITKATKFIAP